MLTTLLLTVAVSAATPQESCQLEANKVFVHEVMQVTNSKPTMLTRVGTCDKGDPINIVEKKWWYIDYLRRSLLSPKPVETTNTQQYWRLRNERTT